MITCSRQDGTAPSTRQATTPGVHVRHDETQSTKLMRPAINETDETGRQHSGAARRFSTLRTGALLQPHLADPRKQLYAVDRAHVHVVTCSHVHAPTPDPP